MNWSSPRRALCNFFHLGLGGLNTKSPKERRFDPWLEHYFSSFLFCREKLRSKGSVKARRRRARSPTQGRKFGYSRDHRATPVHADRGTRCFLVGSAQPSLRAENRSGSYDPRSHDSAHTIRWISLKIGQAFQTIGNSTGIVFRRSIMFRKGQNKNC